MEKSADDCWPKIGIGDRVTYENFPVYRRWWQFWKPRVRYENQVFTVTEVATADWGAAVSTRPIR